MTKNIIKKIKRKCLVCGKKISVTVYRDRRYRNGHYFGVVAFPINGSGEYKRLRTSRLAGKRITIAKWTGKERKVEYWECDACYNESAHESWLEAMLEDLYGRRCPDYESECGCCHAWSVYDAIINKNRGRL